MTVINSDLPPSRAGSLPLIADDLALNFANTESGRGSATHQNHLRSGENVVQWLEHADAMPPEDVDWLREAIVERPALAADLLAKAVDLRRAVHGVGVAIGHGVAPPETALADLAALYGRFIAEAALVPELDACRWRWSIRKSPLAAALGPIALAAVKLFTQGDFHRIRECGGRECGWLFYDTSKNNRRRWCEMEVCGNRAKQRRLAARRRRD